MTHPLAAFLEGLTGGFEGGYGLRQSRDDRRRRQAEEDRERQRRDFERGRGDAERAQETGIKYVPSRAPDAAGRFDERIAGIRQGVGASLMPRTEHVPTGAFAGAAELPRVRGLDDRIQFGGFEQVRPSADEQRALDTELRDAELAAAVGNALARQRPELGYAPGSREAMLVGMGRLPAEAAPWQPRTRDEQLDWLRDTGVIAQRTRAGSGREAARQDLGSVERQVDDTRADLSRAERDAPERPMVFLTPEQETTYRADSTASADRVRGLRQRADSLGRVRDSLAAVVQGRPPRPAATKTPAEWVAEVRREYPSWTPEQVATEARRRAGAR